MYVCISSSLSFFFPFFRRPHKQKAVGSQYVLFLFGGGKIVVVVVAVWCVPSSASRCV